jgi:hypothetical protein
MKRLLFLLIACGCLLTVQAQKHGNINFGIKAGLNLANLNGDDVSGSSMLATFHGGAMVHIPFGGMWAVQPELMFSGEGAKFDGGKTALGYLNVPIMFQYVNPSGFYAETGPTIGFLMSAKDKEDGGTDTDIKDQLKSTDFLWGIGIGYKMKSGFGIGGRYNFGLSNIVDVSGTDVKNTVINLGVFYTFGGEKK